MRACHWVLGTCTLFGVFATMATGRRTARSSGNGGGWKTPHRTNTREALDAWNSLDDAEKTQRCPIERVAWGSIAEEEFLSRYVTTQKPVLFTDAMAGFCPKPRQWSRRGLLSRHGHTAVTTGTGGELAQYGGRSDHKLSLQDLVEQFGSEDNAENEMFLLDPKLASTLSNAFAEPRLLRQVFNMVADETLTADAPVVSAAGSSWKRISLGGDGAGLGLHAHAQFWLGVIHGFKRWLLFPPGRLAARTSQTWFVPNRMLGVPGLLRELAGSEGVVGMHDCVQGPGELLYVTTLINLTTITLRYFFGLCHLQSRGGSVCVSRYRLVGHTLP
eukprot:COSAG02_NODE_1428_length_12662_cov_12.695137_10_plen_330_part_00